MGLIGGVVLASTEFGYPNSLVRGLSRLPARSALLPSAEVSTGHPRPLKPRRKVVLMRSRNIQIPLRLSEEEYAVLMKKVGKCRCSRESYIRSLINGFSPKEAPPADYYKILSKISRESLWRRYGRQIKCFGKLFPRNAMATTKIWDICGRVDIVPAKEIRIIYSVAVRFVLCNANKIFTVGSNKIKHKVLAVRRAVRA